MLRILIFTFLNLWVQNLSHCKSLVMSIKNFQWRTQHTCTHTQIQTHRQNYNEEEVWRWYSIHKFKIFFNIKTIIKSESIPWDESFRTSKRALPVGYIYLVTRYGKMIYAENFYNTIIDCLFRLITNIR